MTLLTLGTAKEGQRIDDLSLEKDRRYMHHYNFPPYSVGETGRMGSPKRRDIGHGALAQRASIRRPSPSTTSRSTRALRDEADRVREFVGPDDRLERPLGERAVADVAPLRRAHASGLPDRVGREVVVVHVAAIRLEREVVDPLALLGGAERQQRHDLRLAASEEPRAVRARADRRPRPRSGGSPLGFGRPAAACRRRSSGGRGSCRSPRTPS